MPPSKSRIADFARPRSGPVNLALTGTALYVADTGASAVEEYSATTGTEVSTSSFEITGVNPDALAFAVPEPSTTLLLLGSGAMLLLRRRRPAV